MRIVDANVYLRYLIKDDEDSYFKAKDLIESEDIFLPIEVLCEIVYVLLKVYRVDRLELSQTLHDLIQQKNINMLSGDVADFALSLFIQTKLDFVDCLLAGYEKINSDIVISFDEKLTKIISSLT